MQAHQGMGRGYGADDLYRAHMEKVRKQLDRMKPGLKERGAELIKAQMQLEKALEQFRIELRRHVGDAMHDALKMMRSEAEKQIQLEQLQADQKDS